MKCSTHAKLSQSSWKHIATISWITGEILVINNNKKDVPIKKEYHEFIDEKLKRKLTKFVVVVHNKVSWFKI